jgi:hypothetical protein
LPVFRRSKVEIKILSPDHSSFQGDQKIILTFDLLKIFEDTSFIRRSKIENNAF